MGLTGLVGRIVDRELPRTAQPKAILECGIDVTHPLFRNGSDDGGNSVFDRYRSDLTAHCDGILSKVALIGLHEHFERIQLVIERRREWDDDRRGCVFVPNVILDDETRSRPPLF